MRVHGRILGGFALLGSSGWIFRRLRLDVKLIVFFFMRRGHLGGYQGCSSPQYEAAVGESEIITIDRRYWGHIQLQMVRAYCNGSACTSSDVPPTHLISLSCTLENFKFNSYN